MPRYDFDVARRVAIILITSRHVFDVALRAPTLLVASRHVSDRAATLLIMSRGSQADTNLCQQ